MTSDAADRLKSLLPDQAVARLQSLRLADGRATLVLDATGLSAPARDGLEASVKSALEGAPGVAEVRVAMMADKAVQKIVAVGSGKGGVGKSTVAANLAVALSRGGRKVGLVDADIYGPSQARLMGTEGQRPVAHDNRLVPVASQWGVPVLSMAHLSQPGQAIAWRGPMASGALTQLLEGHWDEAEILVVDLPPGTGDIQLTMLQKFKPAGAVIVSTPQDLALIDATRAVELFEKGGVPVIGVVENMAGYACPHCGEVSDPFGAGGAEAAARSMGTDFLGRIPLDIAIRRESDAGTPTAAGEGPQARAFADLAGKVMGWLDAH
ncbi:Mrp/NBP35 family ATP-binding protein [Novosphingobium mangrovi (ex Huang et al. 2023)]|uniref:Iron-sulfur cluster carrier protein n=1 Tax=Novosphingobium mangrovi (ex Huang et al. 2023) TaxID=2976432 RepID=A0ABT2I8G1_9SPHN|nr:Mrp/NBP35 family ATP-binding protein [Novosphingobium mangrovi (ex Huang et al. 2023)]MCT2401105.1 Mrp/NBP35 family ATP-binding protein [Novosphingobium mangrovi (ex Huang et al. 2023)]